MVIIFRIIFLQVELTDICNLEATTKFTTTCNKQNIKTNHNRIKMVLPVVKQAKSYKKLNFSRW